IIEGHNQFPDEAEMIVQNGLELVKKAAAGF
ncbi:FMN-dependent NADH-azoreductase, partial [Clostridium perfringens]